MTTLASMMVIICGCKYLGVFEWEKRHSKALWVLIIGLIILNFVKQ